MANNVEETFRNLKARLNAFKEQNDKLQGSIRILQATNENLQTKNDKYKDEVDTYKKEFNMVFIKNIGNAWERYNEQQKKEMTLSEKSSFLTKEINLSKIYIRDSIEKKYKKEIEKLNDELKTYKFKNQELEKKIKNIDAGFASSLSNITKNNTDSIFDDNDNDNIKRKNGHNIKRTNDNTSSLGIDEIEKANSKKINTKEDKHDDIEEPPRTKNDIDKIVKDNLTTKSNEEDNVDSETNFNNEKELQSTLLKTEPIILDYIGKWKKLPPETQKEILYKINSMGLKNGEVEFIITIGRTGYFMMPNIKQEINPKYHASLYPIRNSLISNNLLVEGNPIPAGGPGQPIRPFMLTDLGFWCYIFTAKKNPVDSLLKSLAKNQKSVGHGVHIQKIIDILSSNGYFCSQEDTKITKDGKSSICDILARKDLKEFRIEYEEGNYSNKGYFIKFKNILDVTDYLIFICINVETANKLKDYFFEFVNNTYSSVNELKKLGKFYSFISISELQNNPDILMDNWNKFKYNR